MASYLTLIENQSRKGNPNPQIIQSNLRSASQILDEYITETELTEKAYITKEVANLTNYYTKTNVDAIVTEINDNLDEIIERKALREALDKLLETFTPREQEIIRLRFGFDGMPQTLEEVGQFFNITRERVRQIENKCKHACPTRHKHAQHHSKAVLYARPLCK